MKIKTLEDAFVEQLKDIHDAERRITKALPKMARTASSKRLKDAFTNHLEETENHVDRLDQVFEQLGKTPGRKTCEAMVGLLREGDALMAEEAPDEVMDAALIAAAQKVEHYEMATYGTLRDWAQQLGHDDAAKLLQNTLDEEGQADKTLTGIAEQINLQAVEPRESETMTSSNRSNARRR